MAERRRALLSGSSRQGHVGPWYRFAIWVLKPLCLLLTRRDWRGAEHVPRTGGLIVASNHISHADPIVLCDYVLYALRRAPRFMAKSEMFRGNGLVARVMRGAGQIPVHRHSPDASLALRDAVAALERSETIVIYPEGTVSRDPDKWPMRAHTGVARLALLSGAPVVPVAQWGAQDLLDSYRGGRLSLWPPKTQHVLAGPPVDLSRWQGRELTAEVLREATDAVMDDLTRLVEELRGEPAPPVRYDPRGTVPPAHDGRRTA